MESSTKNGRRKDKIRADGVARPNKSQSSSRRKETQHGAGMTITTVEENETIGDGDTGLGTLLENDSNSGVEGVRELASQEVIAEGDQSTTTPLSEEHAVDVGEVAGTDHSEDVEDPTASAGVTLSPVDDTASRQSTTPPLLESSGGAEGDVTDLLLADDVQDATVPEAAVPSPANVSGSGDSITLLPAEVGNGGEGDAVALPFPEDVQDAAIPADTAPSQSHWLERGYPIPAWLVLSDLPPGDYSDFGDFPVCQALIGFYEDKTLDPWFSGFSSRLQIAMLEWAEYERGRGAKLPWKVFEVALKAGPKPRSPRHQKAHEQHLMITNARTQLREGSGDQQQPVLSDATRKRLIRYTFYALVAASVPVYTAFKICEFAGYGLRFSIWAYPTLKSVVQGTAKVCTSTIWPAICTMAAKVVEPIMARKRRRADDLEANELPRPRKRISRSLEGWAYDVSVPEDWTRYDGYVPRTRNPSTWQKFKYAIQDTLLPVDISEYKGELNTQAEYHTFRYACLHAKLPAYTPQQPHGSWSTEQEAEDYRRNVKRYRETTLYNTRADPLDRANITAPRDLFFAELQAAEKAKKFELETERLANSPNYHDDTRSTFKEEAATYNSTMHSHLRAAETLVSTYGDNILRNYLTHWIAQNGPDALPRSHHVQRTVQVVDEVQEVQNADRDEEMEDIVRYEEEDLHRDGEMIDGIQGEDDADTDARMRTQQLEQMIRRDAQWNPRLQAAERARRREEEDFWLQTEQIARRDTAETARRQDEQMQQQTADTARVNAEAERARLATEQHDRAQAEAKERRAQEVSIKAGREKQRMETEDQTRRAIEEQTRVAAEARNQQLIAQQANQAIADKLARDIQDINDYIRDARYSQEALATALLVGFIHKGINESDQDEINEQQEDIHRERAAMHDALRRAWAIETRLSQQRPKRVDRFINEEVAAPFRQAMWDVVTS